MFKTAQFRFYEELNDFLPSAKRKIVFAYEFNGNPSVKDAIEAIGVPHTEVDLVLVNSKSVTFSYHLRDGDIVSVYPVFECMDISDVTHLRKKPLRVPKFILDVHLGRLARYLRLFGFDTLYENEYNDEVIIKLSQEQKRIILTRDVKLLKNNTVTHGYWIRSKKSQEQLREIIHYFDLYSGIKPFYRCTMCNGMIQKISKEIVKDRIEPDTNRYYNEFYQCESCHKIYWKGSHYFRMKGFIEDFIKDARGTVNNDDV